MALSEGARSSGTDPATEGTRLDLAEETFSLGHVTTPPSAGLALRLMNNELERIWKEPVANLWRHYIEIYYVDAEIKVKLSS
jgi:hypothetical protein